MKQLLLIVMFVITVFGSDFLDPKDAFKPSVTQTKDNIIFTLKLDDTIYVYDEFLNISIVQPKKINLTKDLKIPKPIKLHEFIVHLGTLIIKVPKSLIQTKIGDKSYELKFEYQGCSKKGLCYSPMDITYKSPKISNSSKPTTTTQNGSINETDSITNTLKSGNILLVLLTFFGFGLLLALTPCIFPMIPILSSIIVQQSNKDGGKMSSSKGFILSLVYVLAMSIAYTVAGVLAGLFGANIQAMLQNPYVIISFSLVFVALAFSMFGYYEITLPASWQTALSRKSDEGSRQGGLVGVAIMGFLSALIVGPCVAPPLAGALVYIGQTGDAILGGSALFVMSLGMGVPLLAIGIGAGKYMPKPGGWMNIVSKVFGVVMLAIAIWMLDRIVPFMVTVVLTVILAMGSALYLIKFGNKFGKIVAAILMIGSSYFVMYSTKHTTTHSNHHYIYVKTIKELNHIVATSKKPIMVDFWATWCVSCKELDNITFKDPKVQNVLKNYILLKVDVTKNTQDDKDLMKQFNLFGPPALIFFKNGKEIVSKRIIGYKSPKEFINIVK